MFSQISILEYDHNASSYITRYVNNLTSTVFFFFFQTDLIDPAVKGTLNVLESCAKVPSIKRVVLTSSMASVIFNGKPLNPDTMVDETWFSDIGYCEKMKVCRNAGISSVSF